jgi:hypothetical protein
MNDAARLGLRAVNPRGSSDGNRPLDTVLAAAEAFASLAAVIVVAALLEWFVGHPWQVRGWYRLELPVTVGRVNAWSILRENLGVALPLFALPWAPAGRFTGRVLDVLIALVLVINAGLVGVALAAYGRPLLYALSWHGPLELSGFAVAAGCYLHARRHAPSLRATAALATVAVLLLAAAAVVEAGTLR